MDMNKDNFFMMEALKEAKKAFDADEVPVGCVLVFENKVIARGYNQIETLNDATAHAEMLCLTAAFSYFDDWRLKNTTLYCTLEPCIMCAGAIILARVDRLVWGAKDLKAGASGSFINVFEKTHPMHNLQVVGGVLQDLSLELMKKFFQEKRKKNRDF